LPRARKLTWASVWRDRGQNSLIWKRVYTQELAAQRAVELAEAWALTLPSQGAKPLLMVQQTLPADGAKFLPIELAKHFA
jgi:hypothetical protein